MGRVLQTSNRQSFPVRTVWCAYTHMPGGNIVVIHFQTEVVKENLGGGKIREVIVDPEKQASAFEKSENVSLFIVDQATGTGKLERNKMLIFPDPTSLEGDPKAADKVIAWAIEKGMRAYSGITTPAKSYQAGGQEDKALQERVAKSETEIASIKKTVSETSEKIDQLLKILADKNKEAVS